MSRLRLRPAIPFLLQPLTVCRRSFVRQRSYGCASSQALPHLTRPRLFRFGRNDGTEPSQQGFTVPELIVVMVVIGLVVASMFTFLTASMKRYMALQQDGTAFGSLAAETQRVAAVLRGLTDISSASSDDITAYAYFYPTDTYVSIVHYYKNAAKTQLLADVTPMTANPPIGTPITANKKTYTIIPTLYANASTATFTYLDSLGNTLVTPISDLHTIKGIKITLSAPADTITKDATTTMSLQISLRNRKTNL